MRGGKLIRISDTSSLVSLLRSYFAQSKVMNKRISTKPHCFLSVVGPAEPGKNRLIGHKIVNQAKIFSPSCDKIIYFHNHYQELYGTILMNCESTNVDIEFIQGLEWKSMEKAEAQKKRILLVLDDLFLEVQKSRDFLPLVIAGRNRNIHLLVLRHNLFQQRKSSKTIDWNVTQIILFNCPRDSEQIGLLGRQLGERHVTMEAYKRATRKLFGPLMIDVDVRGSKTLRYSSKCSGDEPSLFYCSTDQLYLNLSKEFTKFLYS